jgi:hypothetical protein
MTNEEIQAIRQQYQYDPSTLKTGKESPVTDVNARLAKFRGQEVVEAPKTTLGSKVKAVVGGVSSGIGTDLALSTIDVVGRKAVESLPDDFQVAGITKQQMLENLSGAPKLREQFKQEMGGMENPELFTAGQVAGTVSAVAPAVKTGLVKLAETSTGQKAIGKVVETVGKAKGQITDKLAQRNVGKVTELLNPTEELLTPLQRKQAIQEGRQTIKTTKLGGTEVGYTPTAETVRASELLADTVKASDKPNVIFAKVKSKIATKGAEAETYLAKNPVKITNAEDAKVFSTVRAQAEKNLTETELKAYDEQIKLFQKQLLGRKGGYTTENYYKAIKDWEENIAEHLPKGKEAILDPSGVASAKIHAASDIRKAVRDLIGSKHPDFKDKMYDLASLYEAKGNALQIAAKQKSKSFLQKNPRIKTGLQIGAGAVGIQQGVNLLRGE